MAVLHRYITFMRLPKHNPFIQQSLSDSSKLDPIVKEISKLTNGFFRKSCCMLIAEARANLQKGSDGERAYHAAEEFGTSKYVLSCGNFLCKSVAACRDSP